MVKHFMQSFLVTSWTGTDDFTNHIVDRALELSILSQRRIEKTGRATDYHHQPLYIYIYIYIYIYDYMIYPKTSPHI